MKKNPDLIRDLHDYDVLLDTNEIFMFGVENYNLGNGADNQSEPGIEYIIANRLIRNLRLCQHHNKGKELVIHMKTCGGFWEEGMAMYDAIRHYPEHVKIISYTHARSMSSIILQAADHRVLMPNSNFMFHDGEFYVGGTVKQVYSSVEWAKKVVDPAMMKIYTERLKEKGKVKNPERWLRELMDKKEDVYFTPNEAVYYGFADEVANFE